MESLDKTEKLEELSNNELLLEIKNMELSYEALKQSMLKDFDKLVEIETKFNHANKILVDRLKGK